MSKRKLPVFIEGTPFTLSIRCHRYADAKPPKRRPLPLAVQQRLERQTFMVGDFPNPGRAFLENFCRTVRSGGQLHPGHLLQVVTGLEEILKGASAGTAFDLNRGRGNKRTQARELRDQAIASEVRELRKEAGYGELDDAISRVADRWSLSTDSVSKIYKSRTKQRHDIEGIPVRRARVKK